MTDWIEPKTLLSPDNKQRALVDYIVKNDLLYLKDNAPAALGTLGTKNPAIDADKVVYRDSAASDALVTSTWAQIKAFLKTYFDGLYAAGESQDYCFTVAWVPADHGIFWDDATGEVAYRRDIDAESYAGLTIYNGYNLINGNLVIWQ